MKTVKRDKERTSREGRKIDQLAAVVLKISICIVFGDVHYWDAHS